MKEDYFLNMVIIVLTRGETKDLKTNLNEIKMENVIGLSKSDDVGLLEIVIPR